MNRVNWRAVGCGGLAALLFVLAGLFGLSRALAPAACPPAFQLPSGRFDSVGEPASSPRLPGSDESLEPAGEVRLGFGWELWVRPGTAPSASGDPLPDEIVLGCGDGSFQAYARSDE